MTGKKKTIRQPRTTKKPFTIVGIGASAGGLAAFKAFSSAIPAATELGMALVLVQHLAPDSFLPLRPRNKRKVTPGYTKETSS